MSWPRGRSRNGHSTRKHRVLDRLRGVIDPPIRGRVSRRALASSLGVSPRTVRRWIDGEDIPPDGAVGDLERWTRRAEMER